MTVPMTIRLEAAEALREVLPAGAIVYTLHSDIRKFSRSIKVFAVQLGQIRDVSQLVARTLDYGVDQRHGGVRVSGWGHLDYGLNLTMVLGTRLYSDVNSFGHRWL
jgi:hypothetical protein